MEITVNIPQNDYVQPTEVRQDVVQKICDAFLRGAWFAVSHDEYPRNYINGVSFSDSRDKSAKKFNGTEMKAAFRLLQEAGYHMHKAYAPNDSWVAYRCSKYPRIENWYMVTEFSEFIDY